MTALRPRTPTRSEIGASLTEMALLVACVAFFCIASLSATGEAIKCRLVHVAFTVESSGEMDVACLKPFFALASDGGSESLSGNDSTAGTQGIPNSPANAHNQRVGAD